MKNLGLFGFLTQLGMSVALPLGGIVWLAVWLKKRLGVGNWLMVAGVLVGLICAANGLRVSLIRMNAIAKNNKTDESPVSFHDHE